MARIPYPDLSQEFTTLGAQLSLFRMLAHAGTTGKRVLSLGNALLSQLELPPKLRELAILQVATVLEIDIDEPAGERLLDPPSREGQKGGD